MQTGEAVNYNSAILILEILPNKNYPIRGVESFEGEKTSQRFFTRDQLFQKSGSISIG